MIPNHEANNQNENRYRILEDWLKSRQSLIVSFSQLCMLKPFDTAASDLPGIKENLDEFCQHLIDYVCIGQFHLFEKIARNTTKQSPDRPLLNQLLKMTLQAIHFNDLYTQPNNLSKLENELSQLGETIALRLELEDELLNRYSYLFRSQPFRAKN
jgi:regulator of sigma D